MNTNIDLVLEMHVCVHAAVVQNVDFWSRWVEKLASKNRRELPDLGNSKKKAGWEPATAEEHSQLNDSKKNFDPTHPHIRVKVAG